MLHAPIDRRPRQASADLRRIEALLAAYPDVSADELNHLRRWFAREASAYDVAMVACNEDIREGYSRFRTEHVDPLAPAELAVAAGFAALAIASIGALMWVAG